MEDRQDLLIKLFELDMAVAYGTDQDYEDIHPELNAVEEEIDRLWGAGTCERLSIWLTQGHASSEDMLRWARDEWSDLKRFLEGDERSAS